MAIKMTNGEFVFSMKEKIDRDGKTYLFGGITFINAVLFVRPTGESGPDGLPRWEATVRPYTGQQPSNPDEATWEDGPPRQQHRRTR